MSGSQLPVNPLVLAAVPNVGTVMPAWTGGGPSEDHHEGHFEGHNGAKKRRKPLRPGSSGTSTRGRPTSGSARRPSPPMRNGSGPGSSSGTSPARPPAPHGRPTPERVRRRQLVWAAANIQPYDRLAAVAKPDLIQLAMGRTHGRIHLWIIPLSRALSLPPGACSSRLCGRLVPLSVEGVRWARRAVGKRPGLNGRTERRVASCHRLLDEPLRPARCSG